MSDEKKIEEQLEFQFPPITNANTFSGANEPPMRY